MSVLGRISNNILSKPSAKLKHQLYRECDIHILKLNIEQRIMTTRNHKSPAKYMWILLSESLCVAGRGAGGKSSFESAKYASIYTSSYDKDNFLRELQWNLLNYTDEQYDDENAALIVVAHLRA